jgi:hypothetical protein
VADEPLRAKVSGSSIFLPIQGAAMASSTIPGLMAIRRSLQTVSNRLQQRPTTAGPAFVRHLLATGVDEVRDGVSQVIAAFSEANLASDADGQVKRAAERLALIGAAGELAREWGIVPWQEGEGMEAARRILGEWITARGGTSAAEEQEAILQVRRFFEAHGEARFESLDEKLEDSDADAPVVRPARDVANGSL